MVAITETTFIEYKKTMNDRLRGVEEKVDSVEHAVIALPKQIADEMEKKFARKDDVLWIKRVIYGTIVFVMMAVGAVVGNIILKAIQNGWVG